MEQINVYLSLVIFVPCRSLEFEGLFSAALYICQQCKSHCVFPVQLIPFSFGGILFRVNLTLVCTGLNLDEDKLSLS